MTSAAGQSTHETHPIRTVAVMSPGDMGHAIGAALRRGGLRVITCLRGRSPRTRDLAEQAGIEDVAGDEALVEQADVLLSVLVPAEALGLAERLAAAIRTTHGTRAAHHARGGLLYADLNAISPQTARRIGAIVSAAGARFVDGGIIGGPPRQGSAGPRIYLSGEHALALLPLRDAGLDVRPMGRGIGGATGTGGEIGQASGLKMCYAALTKGLTALGTELLVAARAMGLSEPLRTELAASQAALLQTLERGLPGMPPKAYRWVGEMEEIAATFGALGLPPGLMAGAADLYRLVERSPLGAETPEARTRGQTAADVVETLAATLPKQ